MTKYLSKNNIITILDKIKKRICIEGINEDEVAKVVDKNQNFINYVGEMMKMINDQYGKNEDNTIEDMNEYTVDFVIKEQYPQFMTEEIIDKKYLTGSGIIKIKKNSELLSAGTLGTLSKRIGGTQSTPLTSGNQPSLLQSVVQRRSGDFVITEYTIAFDSRHRDVRIWPSASRYQIGFQKKNNEAFGYVNNISDNIKGVSKIELITGIVPNIFKVTNNFSGNTYLLIGVDEIVGRYYNSSPLARNILGSLQYDLDLPINVDYVNVDPVLAGREYKPEPLSTSLTALTVNLLNFNGNTFNFGNDSVKLRYWRANGAVTEITTWLPHGLTTGDLVYFRYTDNAILDSLYDGLRILVVSPTAFTVPVNTTSVGAGLPQLVPPIIGPGGPPINPANPATSFSKPFPQSPPNNPLNPSEFYGFILLPLLQNSFVFKITTLDKLQSAKI